MAQHYSPQDPPDCLGSCTLAFPSGGHVRASKAKVGLLHFWVVIATPSLQVLAGRWPECTKACWGH